MPETHGNWWTLREEFNPDDGSHCTLISARDASGEVTDTLICDADVRDVAALRDQLAQDRPFTSSEERTLIALQQHVHPGLALDLLAAATFGEALNDRYRDLIEESDLYKDAHRADERLEDAAPAPAVWYTRYGPIPCVVFGQEDSGRLTLVTIQAFKDPSWDAAADDEIPPLTKAYAPPTYVGPDREDRCAAAIAELLEQLGPLDDSWYRDFAVDTERAIVEHRPTGIRMRLKFLPDQPSGAKYDIEFFDSEQLDGVLTDGADTITRLAGAAVEVYDQVLSKASTLH